MQYASGEQGGIWAADALFDMWKIIIGRYYALLDLLAFAWTVYATNKVLSS